MNRLIYFALFAIGWTSCQPTDNTQTETKFKPTGSLADLVYNPVRPDGTIDSSFLPVMRFDETTYDFGEVQEGELVLRSFRFRNVGTAPLLITQASSSCGCTVPDWPRQPIAPDSSGTIQVTFNTAGKPGDQTKQVTIFANTYPNEQQLTVRGFVKPVK